MGGKAIAITVAEMAEHPLQFNFKFKFWILNLSFKKETSWEKAIAITVAEMAKHFLQFNFLHFQSLNSNKIFNPGCLFEWSNLF